MEKRDDFVIPEEMAEWIGQKKSEYLSKIIQNMRSDDFAFEEFHEFNHLAEQTIETPDKVYESQEDKETVRTYIRSYTENGGFHQVVRGVLLSDKQNQAQVLVPIMVFVSRKSEMVNLFCEGEVISRPTLN